MVVFEETICLLYHKKGKNYSHKDPKMVEIVFESSWLFYFIDYYSAGAMALAIRSPILLLKSAGSSILPPSLIRAMSKMSRL